MSKFIVIEGPDGSGSTHQTKLLCEKLEKEGYNVLQTAEPTEGPIGKNIRSILSQENMPSPEAVQLLFCADRAQHIAEIKKALGEDTIVVCDRYALSTIVYGQALGIDPHWLRAINDYFLQPDLTIVTLPSFEVCWQRIANREQQDQFEKKEFQQKVHDLYSNTKSIKTHFVDTSQELDASAEEIWRHVQNIL